MVGRGRTAQALLGGRCIACWRMREVLMEITWDFAAIKPNPAPLAQERLLALRRRDSMLQRSCLLPAPAGSAGAAHSACVAAAGCDASGS